MRHCFLSLRFSTVSPSRMETTGPEKSGAQIIVGISNAANCRNGVLCGAMVVVEWLQIAITLRVNEELERGSAHSILQIVGEEVDPGERK